MNLQSARINPRPNQVQSQRYQDSKKNTCTCLCSDLIKILSNFFFKPRHKLQTNHASNSSQRRSIFKIEGAETFFIPEQAEKTKKEENSQYKPNLPVAYPLYSQEARIQGEFHLRDLGRINTFPSNNNSYSPRA